MIVSPKICLLFLLILGTFTALAQTTTPPAAKTLTPAEQKRRDKLEKEIQEQRKFKAEMAERQRQYFIEQAEKERKKKEKEAEREAQKRGEPARAVTTEAPKPSTQAPAQPKRRNTSAPTVQPTTPAAPVPTPTVTPAATNSADVDREKEVRRAADAARKEQADREKAARQVQDNQEKAARQAQTTREREAARQQAQQQKEANRRQAELDREQAKQQREADRERERLAKETQRPPAVSALPTVRPDTVEAFGPRKEFLPKDHLFAPILLDPLQSQTYGSVLPVFVSNSNRYKGSIVPFAFGMQKPFFRRQTGTNRASEWALDLASFTQFEVYQDEKLNKQRRQLVNTDYRVGISYHLRRGPGTWRFRAYHLSSHLGDDFIIRNQLVFRLPNSVNYELIDATYSRQVRDFRVYGGLGIGLRVSDERKPLSAQAGFWYKKPTTKTAQLVGGLDLKLWQQTNFRPGIKAGIGVTAGRGPGNLTFLLETYSGFRPYSIYETDKVFWLGFGAYLQPF